MRLPLLLLCAVCSSCSGFLLKPGQEHVFSYSSSLLTGLPDLASTLTGLAIEAQVVLQAEEGRLRLALTEVKAINFNEELTGPEPLNWRTLKTPEVESVPETLRRVLESPYEVEMEHGQVRRIIFSEDEPHWSVNFKKALVGTIKVQLPVVHISNRIQRRRESWMGVSTEEELQVPDLWTVMEEGVDGVCENIYQFTEIPQHLRHKIPDSLVKTQFCEGVNMFEIIRSRDLTKCQKTTVFLSTRGHEDKTADESRTTRFLGCGRTKATFQLQAVVSEGERLTDLLAFNSEQVLTGSRQVLVLKEVKSSMTPVPAIARPKIHEDLMYEYPRNGGQEERTGIASFNQQMEDFKVAAQDPTNHVVKPLGWKIYLDEDKKNMVVDKFMQIAADMANLENFGEKQVPSTLTALKSFLGGLNTTELRSIFDELRTGVVERRLFLDTLMMTGSSPSVIFFKDLMESGEVSVMEIAEWLLPLPHYIKTPTIHLVDAIFEMIQSPIITSNKHLKANAEIAFASIVNMACFGEDRPDIVFPESVHGKMCLPSETRITSRYLPYLVNQLHAASEGDLHAAILALGTIGHRDALDHLLPYIQDRSRETSTTKSLAIYSLARVTYSHRDVLLPVYSALVANPSEEREVRLAAFSMMLLMDLPMVHMQKLAVSTWFEEDAVVARFISSALRSLAELQTSALPPASPMAGLVQKASTVLPLAKTHPGVLSSSFDHFMADSLRSLGVGYEAQTATINSGTSHVFYQRITKFLKQVKTVPIEFAVHCVHGGGVHKAMANTLDLLKDMVFGSKEDINIELQKMLEQLESIEDSPTDAILEAGIWARLSDDVQLSLMTPNINSVRDQVVEILKRPFASLVKDIKKGVCGKTPFMFTKVFETIPYTAMVPSQLGLPLFTESQQSMLLSLQGEVDLDCSRPVPSIKLTTTLRTASSWSGITGTLSPFQEEVLQLGAGVDTTRCLTLPLEVEVSLEPRTAGVRLEVRQGPQVETGASGIHLVHYQVLPFTTKAPLFDKTMTPIVLDRNTKIIDNKEPRKKTETELGNSFGFDLIFKEETEKELLNLKPLLDVLKNYHYNPLVAFLFLETETALNLDGSPNLRYHKYSLVHNPKHSSTKAVVIDLKLSGAIKEMATEIVHYISSVSTKASKHEEKMRTCLAKMTSDSLVAANALLEVSLVGSSPKTFIYSVTAAQGFGELEQEWVVHLEEETQPRIICVAGKMTLPATRSSNLPFLFKSHLGFGATCEESWLKVASVSSLETTQNKVKVEVTSSEHLPPQFYSLGRLLDSVLKTQLWPYLAQLPSLTGKSEHSIEVSAETSGSIGQFNMTIRSPLDTTIFRNIHLPTWTQELLTSCSDGSMLGQGPAGRGCV